jgi:hypothetical protein
MTQAPATYPTFLQGPATPLLEGPGVAIALGGQNVDGRFAPGAPVVLHGKCGYTLEMFDAMDGRPLTAVLLIAVRRDGVEGWMMPVVDPDAPPHPEPVSITPMEAGGVEYACFSLDLRPVFDLSPGPGKYWVMAAFGDAVTERLPFEVAAEADEGEPKKRRKWFW